ncbi:MAG: hypothetical protein H0U65_12820 [Rubrobacter sp.]|nr:hypothetical protein [Rubrobacter sp.]
MHGGEASAAATETRRMASPHAQPVRAAPSGESIATRKTHRLGKGAEGHHPTSAASWMIRGRKSPG